MSTKRSGLRLVRATPGGRHLRAAILEQVGRKEGLQVTALEEAGLRGIRALFPEDQAEQYGVELLPFGNAVSRVCRLARVQTLRLAQTGQVVEAIAEACSRLPGENPLAAGGSRPGIHRALEKTLQELRGHGLSATDLDVLSTQATPHLGAKLQGLAFVLRESDESLRMLGREHLSNWMTHTLAADPEACEDLGELVVVIQGEITPIQADWLNWLGKTPARVTLIGEIHSGLPDLFSAGVSEFPSLKPKLQVDSESIAERLFVGSKGQAAAIQVDIFSAADALAESEWVLRRCATEVGEGRSTAVLAREISTYAPNLLAASRRLGIPIQLAYRAPLLSNRLIAFFLDLLQALADEDVRALIRPFASAYAGLSLSTQAGIEAALREVSRAGSEAWDLLESIQETLTGEVPWLAPILEWRGEAWRAPAELHEWFGRLMNFADLVPWQEAATQWPEFMERDARAQAAMQRSLTERASLSKVHRLRPYTFTEALAWIKETWVAADYSLPAGSAAIRVVSRAAELGDVESVYAVGLLEGEFPRRPREDPILGDLERQELSRLAKFTSPLLTSRDEAKHEREEFVRLCAAARTHLTLSYRQTSEDRDTIPTAYLHEAKAAVSTCTEHGYGRIELAPSTPELEADIRLSAALNGPLQPVAGIDFEEETTRLQFKWEADRAFEPQQLRRAVLCPFQFFARDRLGLRPNRRRQIWTRLLDLPDRAQLATQPTPEVARLALNKALEELLDSLIGRIDPWELALARSGGRRQIADWVEREFRARELWPREDMRLNVPFGTEGLNNRAGNDIFLTGAAPALGQMGPYTLVRLYEARPPDRVDKDSRDDEFLYYVLWGVLARAGNPGTVLEVEGFGAQRSLFVLQRQPGAIRSEPAAGLKATVITTDEEAGTSVGARARDRMRFAVGRIREGDVRPTPSTGCTGCFYGELCRRSSEYGESDDPFEGNDG